MVHSQRMDDYVKTVEDATQRVKDLMKKMEKLVEGHALQSLVKAMMSFRGVQCS